LLRESIGGDNCTVFLLHMQNGRDWICSWPTGHQGETLPVS